MKAMGTTVIANVFCWSTVKPWRAPHNGNVKDESEGGMVVHLPLWLKAWPSWIEDIIVISGEWRSKYRLWSLKVCQRNFQTAGGGGGEETYIVKMRFGNLFNDTF